MQNFLIPWSCLDSSDRQKIPTKTTHKLPKTFAHVVYNVCDIPLSQLPRPCPKGEGLVLAILEEEYLEGIEECKHNLHGRIVWPKGVTPLTVLALK